MASEMAKSNELLGPSLRPEAELLLCCLRTSCQTTLRQRIPLLLQPEIDWNDLLVMAEKHRVMPMLYRNLKRAGTSGVSAEHLQILRQHFHRNAQHNFRLCGALHRLMSLFAQHAIRTIPYKGVVLAAMGYGQLTLRQVYDIDLLVHRQDFERGRALLLSQGYHLVEIFDHEQSFRHPDTQVEVDLHWGFTPYYFPLQVDFDALWQRLVTVVIGNASVQTFSPADLLLILCIQVAKDSWERQQRLEHLAKVCDIAAVLKAADVLPWKVICQRAADLGARRMLHFGLYLAHSLLGAVLPHEVRHQVYDDGVSLGLARQACAALFGADDRLSPTTNSRLDLPLRLRQLEFYLKMRERPRDRFAHLTAIIRTLLFGESCA